MMNNPFETEAELLEILQLDAPEIEKLAQAYRMVINKQIEFARGAVELARATGDKQAVVQEQIKQGVYKNALEIFSYCCMRVTGKRTRDA
jgi:hypothetical protein